MPRQEISEKYLEAIVKSLVRARYLTGLRGKSGGYRTTFCDALPRDLSLTTGNFGSKNSLLGQVFGSILFQQGRCGFDKRLFIDLPGDLHLQELTKGSLLGDIICFLSVFRRCLRQITHVFFCVIHAVFVHHELCTDRSPNGSFLFLLLILRFGKKLFRQ